MCKIFEVHPYSGGSSKGAFSARPCLKNPNHAFKKPEKSAWHKKVKLKLSSNGAYVNDHIIVGAEKDKLK